MPVKDEQALKTSFQVKFYATGGEATPKYDKNVSDMPDLPAQLQPAPNVYYTDLSNDLYVDPNEFMTVAGDGGGAIVSGDTIEIIYGPTGERLAIYTLP